MKKILARRLVMASRRRFSAPYQSRSCTSQIASTSRIDAESSNPLRLHHLPLYLFARHLIVQDSLPGSYKRSLHQSLTDYGRHRMNLGTTGSREAMDDAERATLRALLDLAEVEEEEAFDPDVAYLDICKDHALPSIRSNSMKDSLCEMYFQLADRCRWDFDLLHHDKKHLTRIKLSGRRAFHLLKFECGVNQKVNKFGIPIESTSVRVHPHFYESHLPALKEEDLESTMLKMDGKDGVRVRHVPSGVDATSFGHNLILDKIAAVSFIKQLLQGRDYLKTAGQRFQALDSVDAAFRFDAVGFKEDSNLRLFKAPFDTVIDARLDPSRQVLKYHEEYGVGPEDLKVLLEAMSSHWKEAVLKERLKTFSEASFREMCNFSLEKRLILSDGKDASLLAETTKALEDMRETLKKKGEELERIKAEMEEKSTTARRLAAGLKSKDELIGRLSQWKEDKVQILRSEVERERLKIYTDMERKAKSIDHLIDDKYLDRVQSSEDNFQLRSQLDKALTTVEQQRKDLKENATQVSYLSRELAKAVHTMDKKTRELNGAQEELRDFRKDKDRMKLIEEIEERAKECSQLRDRVGELEEENRRLKVEVEGLVDDLESRAAETVAEVEELRGKLRFLEMNEESMAAALEEKEVEMKAVVAMERASLEVLKRQMKNYLKEHSQKHMAREEENRVLEREVETLRKELEAATKKEDFLTQSLAREKMHKDQYDYLMSEEKRVWLDEMEAEKTRLERAWKEEEITLTKRIAAMEKERDELKDTVEQLVAFQQRKQR